MQWRTVGVIEPGFDWLEFGDPILGSTVIRVSHTYAQQPNGPALFRMNLYDGHVNTRRLYPTREQRIIEMRIPPLLEARGVVSWYPALRLGYRTRPHELDNWRVMVEELADGVLDSYEQKFDRELTTLLTSVDRIEGKLDNSSTNNPSSSDQLPNDLDNSP
jgi:hypothetical protein